MTAIIEKKDRRLIPNWRPFSTTNFLGEIDSFPLNSKIKPNLSIDVYIEDFCENSTIPFAADLLSASVVNGFTENTEVKKAANFILERKADATKSQCSIAETIISAPKNKVEKFIEHITINELDSCLPINDYTSKNYYALRIKLLKKDVTEFPYNPILWVELSRYYSILGQEKQALKAMKIAVQLAPENRFVLRCATRLFSHYGELELAHDILRKNEITNFDPWLTSAEISVAMLKGKTSRFLKRGFELVNSKNLSPFSITELASSIATFELLFGSRKKSKKMFMKSLVSPNDNSLAQIEWVLNNKDESLLNKSQLNIHAKHNFEAQAIANFHDEKLIEALNNTYQWFCDMPFSKSSVIMGSSIADILDNRSFSIDFMKAGLIAHPNDAQMLNNIAYYLALENKTIEAISYYEKVNFHGLSGLTKICLNATHGLIYFREKKYEEGRNAYNEAIEQIAKENNKYHTRIAVLNYVREEILANTDHIEPAMQLVSLMPSNENDDIIIKKLRSKVLDLYDKYKNR